jgi:hypothetical protein
MNTILEERRRRGREATRRYRAKKARGGSIKHAVSAPKGAMLREIPGFSNYRADDRGNLYTRLPIGKPRFEDGPYVPWRVLPMQSDKYYLTVKVRPDGEKKRKRVMAHRLVALAFLGPRPPGMFVAHGKNGRRDNSPGNLSYKTPAQNKADELRDGTRYSGKRHHEVTTLPQSFWARWTAGRERKSDLCREFNISRQALHRRLARREFYRPEFAGAFEGLIVGGMS